MFNTKQYLSELSKYMELKIQENRNLNITLINGTVVTNTTSMTGGVSARAYESGSWGFSSSSHLDDSSIRYVINTAKANAEFLDQRLQKNRPFFQTNDFSFSKSFATTKIRLSQKQILDYLNELDAYILMKYPNLTERSISIRCLDMDKSLMTSHGNTLDSLLCRSIIFITLTVDDGDNPIALYQVYGGRGQFEDNFTSPEELFPEIDKLYDELIKKSQGIYASAGLKECILDSDLAGILAHEAIGHTVEADLVLAGSVAGPNINKQVASPLITLKDFAYEYNGETCPIPIYIDDEGTEASDVTIIDKGILKNFMHSKESALHFGVEPQGNGRAYEYSDEPLIRMRNTAILPGTSKLEDMIASVEDGYYLTRTNNGQADSTSEFMFGITMGYEIKSGRIARAIKDTTISGIAFDVLQSVTMVSDEMSWSCAGMCGKKQPIPVGMGGPAIKCNLKIGGR